MTVVASVISREMTPLRLLRTAVNRVQIDGLKIAIQRTIDLASRFVRMRVTPGFGFMVPRNPYEDIAESVTMSSPVIVDAGSYTGTTVESWLTNFPEAEVHAYEPNPELASTLECRYADDSRVTVHQKAVGESPETAHFNQTKKPHSSSLLTPSMAGSEQYRSTCSIDEKYPVEVVRLSDEFNTIDVLKLDIQGAELQALRGSEDLFDDISAVLSEVWFREHYEGQDMFCDIAGYLSEQGFELLNLYDLKTEPDGVLTYGDCVFLPPGQER